ncbi:hypothetical protein BGZ76_000775, partial [Entomortierella beljakovae]
MNLVGATLDNLLLTMRVLAWYYTIADIALILQIYYYRKTSVKASFEAVITHASPEVLASHDHHGEHAPLISAVPSHNYSSINPSEHVHENIHDRVIHEAAMVANATASHYAEDLHHPTQTGEYSRHRRRPSTHSTMTNSSGRYRSKMAKRRKMVRRVLSIVAPLILVTLFAWAYYDWLQCTIGEGGDSDDGSHCGRGNHGGHGKLPPAPNPSDPSAGDSDILTLMKKGGKKHPTEEKSAFDVWAPLILGWGSAVLYLGSRIPQIYKNWRLKSCEGLSIMMFVFSVFGNVFYVASIFLNSLDFDYLIRNMPWWLGSGGTLLFDFTIFFQFYIYRYNSPLSEALKEAAATGELDENALMATVDDESNDDTDTDSTSETLPQHNKCTSNSSKNHQHHASASDSTN